MCNIFCSVDWACHSVTIQLYSNPASQANRVHIACYGEAGCGAADIQIQMESIASLSFDVSGENATQSVSTSVEASFIDSVDIDCFGSWSCYEMDFTVSAAHINSFRITANGEGALYNSEFDASETALLETVEIECGQSSGETSSVTVDMLCT